MQEVIDLSGFGTLADGELKQRLAAAIATVAGNCDGAKTLDGVGFDGTDTVPGRMLAAVPSEAWDDRMGAQAGLYCIKYQGQIGHDAVDLGLEAKKRWGEQRVRSADIQVVDVDDRGLLVRFGYNPSLSDSLKAEVGGVSWDRDGKVWRASPAVGGKLCDWARQHRVAVTSQAVDFVEHVPAAALANPYGVLITESAGKIVLKSTTKPPADQMEAIKALPSRRWVPALGWWEMPHYVIRDVRDLVERFGWATSPEFEAMDDRDPAAVPVKIEVLENLIIVRFPYNEVLMAAIKSELGGRWSKADRAWKVPIEMAEQLVDLIARADVQGGEGADELLTAARQLGARIEASRQLAAELDVDGLGLELHPFQKAGVNYILDSRFTVPDAGVEARGCILGDEMGLGKTPQFIASAWHSGEIPALCITPAGLVKQNWLMELVKWVPAARVLALDGWPKPDLLAEAVTMDFSSIPTALFADVLKPGEPRSCRLDNRTDLRELTALLQQADFVVINYDLIGITDVEHRWYNEAKELWTPLLKAHPFRAVGADESHLIKGHDAIRTIGAIEIARSVQARGGMAVGISGSPVLNQRVEMASQLDFIGRLHEFGGSRAAVKREKKLAQKMRARCYIGRMKMDVRKELPPRQHTPLSVPTELLDPHWWAEYQKAEADLLEYIAERAYRLAEEAGDDPRSAAMEAKYRAAGAEHLVAITTLKRLAARAKLPQTKKWVNDFLVQKPESKIIVFAHHVDVLKELGLEFGVKPLIGDMPAAERMEMVQSFQTDPNHRVAVMSIKAGGVGVTMTAAEDVMFVEYDWSPKIHDQAIDRCYGRMNDMHGATGWYMFGLGTIDEAIGMLLDEKREEVLDATEGDLDAPDSPSGSSSIFTDLVMNLTRRALS